MLDGRYSLIIHIAFGVLSRLAMRKKYDSEPIYSPVGRTRVPARQAAWVISDFLIRRRQSPHFQESAMALVGAVATAIRACRARISVPMCQATLLADQAV